MQDWKHQFNRMPLLQMRWNFIFKPVLTPKQPLFKCVTWTQLMWQILCHLFKKSVSYKWRYKSKFMTNTITKFTPDVSWCSWQSARGSQLTCAACSGNESLILTVTFTFASLFADMSMLATHCQCHKNRNRLATAVQRLSVHVYERSPILST